MGGEPVGPAAENDVNSAQRVGRDPDVVLMLRVQQGDHAAFQDLFRKYGPRVLRYTRRLVRTDARAEEITQDVFQQVFRFRTRYRPEARFATWLFTIATNLSLNELRRPERRLRVDLWENRDGEERREGPPLPDPTAVDPEQGAASRELAAQLEAAIAGLPPKQRAALMLSRMDGLAYQDVASALGCTEGAVKALIFRATQSLKASLRDFL
ncbi:MAG: sigma-70 family RNA polymerase sigma factor [Candidatus Binatia bacterium]